MVSLTLAPATLRAQWNTNTSVNLAISGLPIADMVSVPTSDGKTWIAFYHENTGNYDMRAQLIDEDGFKLLGNDGVLVSNQPSGTATFVFNACVDNSNNLIIGCQDERSGTMQAVVYKISPAGAHLWNSNGIILGNGMVPNMTALSGNDIAVVWNDDAGNTLKLQKITASGTIAWANAVSLMVGSSTTTRGQLIGNTSDKFTVVYQKNAGGISTNLYAQMFNSSGTALYAPLQICNQTTAPYRYYSITAEADTTYFGYYSSTGFRFNSFVQRINPGGTIPYGMNGAAFNTYTSGSDNYQMETSIGLEPGSPYIWSVASFCDPNQTNYGVYVQKFLKSTGARQFTDMGKVVYPVTSSRDMKAGEIAIVDDNPMFASYNSDYKIFATRLNASGNFVWPGNRVELSSTSGTAKGRFGFTKISDGRCAVVWTEDRGSGEMGYAQGITPGGLIALDVATQGGGPATITIAGGSLQLVATVYPVTANQSVTWSILPVTGAASISATGLVTGISNGTVWAKATSVQDLTLSDSILITLTNQVALPPTVITLAASGISLDGAQLNGSVNANYFTSAASFEWGLTNAYGSTVNATPNQVTGNTTTSVSAPLSGLLPGTTYHFRCVASNSGGNSYGQDLTFTTLCLLAGTMSPVTGLSTVCAGTTGVTYSVDPFPAATSYVWTLPQGVTVTSGANTNSITVNYSTSATSGDISVYATDGTCNSLPSPSLAVNVIPLPVQAGPITGVQVVCEGDQGIQYSIPSIPGVTDYSWTVPSGAVIVSGQNTTTIIVDFELGSVSGDIIVSGSNDCGNGAASTPLAVSVNPLPGTPGAISGPSHICKEATGVQYSIAPVTNGYGYSWTLPAGATLTSGANTPQITVHFTLNAVSGNISVTPSNGNCIGETSPSFTVTVDPTPATPVITHHGDTLVSSADEGNQWYLEGVLIPGATEKEYIAAISGNYTVIVTINECSSAVSNSILILPVSTVELKPNIDISIYPVPSFGVFTLTIKSENRLLCEIEILNEQGQVVWTNPLIEMSGDFNKEIDLSQVEEGLYLLKLNHNQQVLYRKILIAR
jgi:hypothetical protein